MLFSSIFSIKKEDLLFSTGFVYSGLGAGITNSLFYRWTLTKKSVQCGEPRVLTWSLGGGGA